MTPLDKAHHEMEHSETGRLRFYERLAESELFLLLEAEPEGEDITPRIFPVDDSQLVLVFDREERLAEFAGGAAPYAALSGRLLAEMLAHNNLGLGLNLEVAPSSIILPASAMLWLAGTLQNQPASVEATPTEFHAPHGLPESLITALDSKLALAQGRAKSAYLCGVSYDTGAKSHLLAFIDAAPGAEQALANAVGEALTFSGIEAGLLDVAFFKASDGVAAQLARSGLRFDLPEPSQPEAPSAPGMDPAKPPRLR